MRAVADGETVVERLFQACDFHGVYVVSVFGEVFAYAPFRSTGVVFLSSWHRVSFLVVFLGIFSVQAHSYGEPAFFRGLLVGCCSIL